MKGPLLDSLSSASTAALASLDSGGTPAPETTPQITDTVGTPTPTPATPSTPETPTPQPPAAAQTFKVKDNGQDVEVTLDELLSGHLRHRDYTQKTMALADQRKQIEAQVAHSQQRETAINDFLKSADQIAAYYQYLTGQPLQAAPAAQQSQIDPNQPLTMHQAQELLQRQQAEVGKQFQQVQQFTQAEIAKIHQMDFARQAAALEGEVSGYISTLLKDDSMSVLSSVDGIEDVLCADAMKLAPTNFDQTKAAIKQVAAARAEKMNAHYKEMLKASAAQQTQLAQKGIEPPGGTGVTPTPTTFKLGDKSLSAAATAWLESQSKK